MRRLIIVFLNVALVSLLVTTKALAAPAPSPVPAPLELATGRYHVVRAGETLFSIGRLYGVNPWSIASANHLPNPNRIFIGQCLWIPPGCTWNWCGCQWQRCGNWCGWRC